MYNFLCGYMHIMNKENVLWILSEGNCSRTSNNNQSCLHCKDSEWVGHHYIMMYIVSIIFWRILYTCYIAPGAPLTNLNDGGGVQQRFIFYTQKNHNFRICLPQKITTFLSVPKKIPESLFCNLKKSLCFLFTTQKNPSVFHRPKKSLWPKF